MSSGLDDLERRGRWGRREGPRPIPPKASAPKDAIPKPARKPRAKAAVEAPAPVPAAGRVERVVIYLSREQTSWIRDRQIEALRVGKRVSTSRLIRELLDRSMS